jgi:mannose-1-phosphate guanylyltransferase / mannose-6-phosphate isomerase
LARFVEKSNAARATEMFAASSYLWNASNFLCSVRTNIATFRTHTPELRASVQMAVDDGKQDLGFLRLAAAPWAKVTDISIY